MKRIPTLGSLIVFAFGFAVATGAQTPAPVKGVIPYTLEFQQINGPQTSCSNDPTLPPCLHAHSWVPAQKGGIYVLGGRYAGAQPANAPLANGLHFFTTGPNNFQLPQSRNQFLWWIDLEKGAAQQLFDLTKLGPDISDPLVATNQQGILDATGNWYIVGGYGMNSATRKMMTFDTLTRIPIEKVAAIAQDSTRSDQEKLTEIKAAIEVIHDPLFKVTGGALRQTANFFVLVFGQLFDGNYNPFGNTEVNQVYTEQVRFFQVPPGKLSVTNTGSLSSPSGSHPYHRRDLPVVSTVSPVDGSVRIAAFGGVFPTGKIAGFTDVVYIQEKFGQLQANQDKKLNKRFSQYQCPTIPVYDSANQAVYHTFFGGIGHYWLFQTPAQNSVYQAATKQGRNDGLPFVADITTVAQKANGNYAEFIATAPIPGNFLRGASVDFIPNMSTGKILPNGVVNLNSFANGERVLIGYIFGGIEALNPLPTIPNTGTGATNAIYKIFLTRTPSDGIPASKGNAAKANFDPSKKKSNR